MDRPQPDRGRESVAAVMSVARSGSLHGDDDCTVCAYRYVTKIVTSPSSTTTAMMAPMLKHSPLTSTVGSALEA
jgi:hypothetical protein